MLPDVAGSFDVYASCPVATGATTAATYTINHSTGAATKTVDQKACTAATPWVSLGNYSFPNGVAKTITLKPSATGVVVADAIKLVSTSPVESRSFTYNYDLNGQQTEVKDNNPNAPTDTFKITTDGLARTTQVQELKAGVEKAKTDYTYDLDSNVLSTNAQRGADANTVGVSRYTGYTWDVRNLVATVKAGASPTGTLDTWSYTYDGRGLRSTITKPNGNLATFTYHEDGLPRIQSEKTSGGKLVSSHSLRFNSDGDRSQDVEKLLKANSSEYLDQASNYTYTPARQLEAVVKTGVEKGESESYEYDAAGNTTLQKIGATTSTMTYDRNRLTKTVTGGTTLNQRYDPFGRSTTTDVGTQVVEQNAYDGYDRLVRQQKFDTAGNPTFTRNQTYDPFDRVTNQSEKVVTNASISTRYTFIGLADQVAAEEEKDTTGTWKTSKSYAYGAKGESLSLVDSPVNGTTSKKSFYGTNPHGDTETLTDATTGQTTSTYRYTAYGQPDKMGTTGDDEIKDDATLDADIVNPYRFNSGRFDGATNTYDMGFREYNPGLNRFLTRDMFDGALTDLGLGTDPWNANRYMFGGGNPISRVEYGGHLNDTGSEGGGGTIVGPVLERCPDCQLKLKEDGSWTFEGDGSGDIVKIAKPLLHGTLDAAGSVPVVGEAADGANCAWYAHDGETGNAIASCAAMIPIAGTLSTVGKWFSKGAKLAEEAPSSVPQVLKNKAVGDAAADAIAGRYPGAMREVTLQAASGSRRLDVLTPDGLAIESKVGRTSLGSRERQEIARDVELLNDPTSQVRKLMWEFSTSPTTGRGGPTPSLAAELLRNGIPFTVVR
ncbi:RHS repeat-associated core domain-containing protein [Kribbella sp. VKM Ac-2571]|uniref:golvesin C-terminal-like domain-containing protein n=1 Tax=Kribbella sp. VKM Ac-2571 TaxID=2512222 RepID=UPI0035199D0F